MGRLRCFLKRQLENCHPTAKTPPARAKSEAEAYRHTPRSGDEAIAVRREGGWDESFAIASDVLRESE